MKSWSTSDNFSSKVIYDFQKKQYVGVFSKTFLKLWDTKTEDINKIKRTKMHKPIYEIVNVSVNKNKRSLIIYEDGSCESLEAALESRGERKNIREFVDPEFAIESVQLTNGIFSYVKVLNKEKHFCYTSVDETTLKSHDTFKSFCMTRYSQEAKLMDCAVTLGKSGPALYTIWSDKRLFKQVLNPTVNSTLTIGTLHSIIDVINASISLALTPISEDCLAIYASNNENDGSFVILYNIKYKIVQSRVLFKVYLSKFRLWSIRNEIFLALGEQLSVIPYRISADQLSNMVGSQSDVNVQNLVEKEMINEDLSFEENLVFEEDQTIVEDFEFKIPYIKNQKIPLNKAKPIFGADAVKQKLNEIYREELLVDLVRVDDQAAGNIQIKLLSNVDETFPILSQNFELFITELEKFGCSEIEITGRVIPVLIKANRTEDIGVLLKKYNHISEQMLTRVIKYLLTCPNVKYEAIENDHTEKSNHDLVDLSEQRKFPSTNIFLATAQRVPRDVLSTTLCCSFDSQTILKYLRKEVTLYEMVQLMDHVYENLSTSFLDDPYDMRGNLVEGNDFDHDTQLFEWMRLLLDSHYQQILLSHDKNLNDKLNLWLDLVDKNIAVLSDMNLLREILAKLSTNKQIHLSKKCNKWYSIEKLQLY